MATSTKKALKAIRSHIQDENYETALYEASELLKNLNENQPDSAQV